MKLIIRGRISFSSRETSEFLGSAVGTMEDNQQEEDLEAKHLLIN